MPGYRVVGNLVTKLVLSNAFGRRWSWAQAQPRWVTEIDGEVDQLMIPRQSTRGRNQPKSHSWDDWTVSRSMPPCHGRQANRRAAGAGAGGRGGPRGAPAGGGDAGVG